MKKVIFVFTYLLAFQGIARETLYLSTNKVQYVVGEQVRFDLAKFDSERHLVNEEYRVIVDLVAPDGQVVQTKSLITSEDGCYFFSLPDSLTTGIYRLIANGVETYQATKRIHIYSLKPEEAPARKVQYIEYAVEGGILEKGVMAKMAIRVTDTKGRGLRTKGTLKNSVDSLVHYIDSDANGIASVEFMPTDSLYQVNFGQTSVWLTPQNTQIKSVLKQHENNLTLQLTNSSSKSEAIQVSLDGESIDLYSLEAGRDSIFDLPPMKHGLHKLEVLIGAGQTRTYPILWQPNVSTDLNLDVMILANNEQGELALEDNSDSIEELCVSVIDQSESRAVNFYEEYYFDQLELDLQLVEDRDFDAYLILFYDRLVKRSNEERMAAGGSGGVLSYKEEFPYDQLSMLNLNSLHVIDRRNENIKGIHNFESAVGKRSRVFPYHFTTYLQPIEPASFEEKVNYKYPALKSSILMDEKELEWVRSKEIQRNISLSYQEADKDKASLPAPDYVYDLENYDVPNTMIELINYIVKYVSVVKDNSEQPELSMFRHMSTYKYRGTPLIFLNDLPVYDARTVLNLNPKDFIKIEVRNSYRANDHLGNFSLNGSVSFFLKEGMENPLEEAYKDLPVLEPCRNFHKKLVESEYAPDFRHQIYWNPHLKKTKNTFWVDLKSSDLSTTYTIQVTAFMKDGTVAQEKSLLVVQ